MEILAKRIKEEREHCNLTQVQMAELLNIPWDTYRCYESLGKRHANPPLETLVQIANILKTSTDYLLGLSEFGQ